jgi:uncharacterized membrane protein
MHLEYPMNLSKRSHGASARKIAVCAWAALCALAFAPPILASRGYHAAASVIYLCFSPICHQAPERSFAVLGYPLAVCHRCSGIYLGFLLASFINIPWIHQSPRARRYWTLAAILPLLFDALAPFCGLWTNTYLSRFTTGFMFGMLASSLLIRGLAELLDEAPWYRLTIGDSHLKGGLS